VMNRGRWLAVVATAIIAVDVAPLAVHAREKAESTLSETVRLPYQKGRVYRVKLRPGDTVLFELPAGHSVQRLWFDDEWWLVENDPGASEVSLSAKRFDDIVERRGFAHIVTTKGYRISLELEAVAEGTRVPAAFELYDDGAGSGTVGLAAAQEAHRKVDRDLLYAQKMAADEVRAKTAAFRQRLLSRLRPNSDFEWRGDFILSNVTDDGVQTFIVLQDKAADRPVAQFIDANRNPEIVNCELDPPSAGAPHGTYVVNRVLAPGEKFKLILGKQATWISLKRGVRQ
jgi:hypothetical protein